MKLRWYPLMQCVARRIVDGRMLHLIKMWLTAAVMEQDEKGNWRNLGSIDGELRKAE